MAAESSTPKRRIYLNGFDMFTVGHLSFGQWKNPADRSATKRRDLSYWTNLAKILEKGDFNALFLADTYGLYDTYKGSAEPAIRNGAQYPMGDPAIVRQRYKLLTLKSLIHVSADIRHGIGDQESWVRDHHLDFIRSPVRRRKEILNIGPPDRRPIRVEHRDLMERISRQGSELRHP